MGEVRGRQGVSIWKLPVPSTQFCSEPKTTPKNKVCCFLKVAWLSPHVPHGSAQASFQIAN